MKITVNRETCIRAGRCYFEHPGLATENADGFPAVTGRVLTEKDRDAILEMIANCPTQSISLDEPGN
jgi:ferredoxin